MINFPRPTRAALLLLCGFVFALNARCAVSTNLPSLAEVVASGRDLWGEAAMQQPNGPSYEFFENLLPPPRYVDADFHFYPIVLSAPNAKIKARLVSNGSGVNVRGGSRSWNEVGTGVRYEVGTPVIFRVGFDEFRFGTILDRLQHPTLANGYLPIPQVEYSHGASVFRVEAFAATDPILASNGVVFVAFSLAHGSNDWITAQFEGHPTCDKDGKVIDEAGHVLAFLDYPWDWQRGSAHAKIGTNSFATMAIATKPFTAEQVKGWKLPQIGGKVSTNTGFFSYSEQRKRCVETWEGILEKSMNVVVPEPLVNNVWKNLIIQNFSLIRGDRMNYSAGNQYEKMYAAESSDSAIPLMQWGYEEDMRRVMLPILDLVDRRLTNHFASHKLDDVCRYYWQTRDADYIKSIRPHWQKELDWILNQRGGEYGLLPKDNYCTDIEKPVYSFSSNAKCWAALRDLAPVLEEMGDHETAQRVTEAAGKYKKDILAAVEKNIRYETQPPFVPCALFYDEGLHDPITETRIGSYWDLVANYIIGSRIFAGTERETWVPRYFETHGGLCMGLTRSAAANHSFWTGKNRTNPLYGMRYVVDCLQRDDVDRALVNFYGMIAHGMTRNTFIGAEGTAIQPLDEGGRFFYCPPNSSSNGEWLMTLRDMLVQDFDLNEDGRPDTLRLAFATPRRWLEDGKSIMVEKAPTAFGLISLRMESHLSRGDVTATVDLPSRNQPEKTLLRARVPDGWKVTSATVGGKSLAVDDHGTVDLSALKGKQIVHFTVSQH